MSLDRRDLFKGLMLGAATPSLAAAASPAGQDKVPLGPSPNPHWGVGADGQRKADLGNGFFRNPIVPGDHADPTILKDGDDYYVTFSSFHSYPGLVVWRSTDLVNWSPVGFGRWYDPYGKAGRDLYWSQISKSMTPIGFDGYWLDASEAELGGNWGEMRALATAAGPGAEVYNAYPLMHTTGVYDGQLRDAPGKRPFVLTRSAWLGQQRNAAVTWSGDIHGDWEVFRKQIPAGLNFVASGIPYWNTDIGDFFGGEPGDANYRDLFVRWFHYGAFTQMFRVHGTGPAKEIWRFDEPAQQILRRYVELRYRLLPDIYATSWRVTDQGYTMMRPPQIPWPAESPTSTCSDRTCWSAR